MLPRITRISPTLISEGLYWSAIRIAPLAGHPVIHMHVSLGIHLRTPGRADAADGHVTIPAGIRSENSGVRLHRRVVQAEIAG